MTPDAPLRLLLIEENTVAAITLECLLEDLGHQVIAVAATPAQADHMLKAFAPHADMVIYNAYLIGLPRPGLAERVAQSGLPSLVMSRRSAGDLQAFGFTDPYLPQPVTHGVLAQSLAGIEPREQTVAA
ncbi:MAG: hypothetical protein OIF48_06285 [Silicimonas sp.]|nr:hypothetical protein [Silicimonas sp.]